MIKRFQEIKPVEIPNMKGGTGTAVKIPTAEAGEYDSAINVIGKLQLNPGVAVGMHMHKGEEEIMTVLSGRGTYVDDGMEYVVQKGDVMICRNMHTHCVANASKTDVLEIYVVVAKV